MYTIAVDPHVHSVASIHAYSTIEENARAAGEKGLEAIAITDHFGPYFCTGNLFQSYCAIANTVCMPKEMHGVRVFRGVEIDIVDMAGNLAFSDEYLDFHPKTSVCNLVMQSREVVIASVHRPAYEVGSVAQNTQMYINALQNPHVHILGHSGRSGFPYDLDEVISAAKALGKMIEINSHSFSMRTGITEVCRDIAEKCAQLGVYITISSDAHCSFSVGDFQDALNLLREIDFPQELIANASRSRFEERLKGIKKK